VRQGTSRSTIKKASKRTQKHTAQHSVGIDLYQGTNHKQGTAGTK
jgi:hypothetical protein